MEPCGAILVVFWAISLEAVLIERMLHSTLCGDSVNAATVDNVTWRLSDCWE